MPGSGVNGKQQQQQQKNINKRGFAAIINQDGSWRFPKTMVDEFDCRDDRSKEGINGPRDRKTCVPEFSTEAKAAWCGL